MRQSPQQGPRLPITRYYPQLLHQGKCYNEGPSVLCCWCVHYVAGLGGPGTTHHHWPPSLSLTVLPTSTTTYTYML